MCVCVYLDNAISGAAVGVKTLDFTSHILATWGGSMLHVLPVANATITGSLQVELHRFAGRYNVWALPEFAQTAIRATGSGNPSSISTDTGGLADQVCKLISSNLGILNLNCACVHWHLPPVDTVAWHAGATATW